MPRTGQIAQGFMARFEELVIQHGKDEVIPVYIDKGVFCFDLHLEDIQKGGCIEIGATEEDEAMADEAPSFGRQPEMRQ